MHDKHWWKRGKIGNIVGSAIAALALVVGSVMIVHPAVSELAGLAVAQTATQWNNVRDAAVGDNLSNGILAMSLYMFNGSTFDRARGDTANGIDVDVTRISGNVTVIGNQTPADAFANPTNAVNAHSLSSVFNGTTWDRVREATADNLAATGVSTAGNVAFDGSTWDRLTGVSNTNNTATTSQGVRYSTQLSTWSITDTDAGNTQSTVSRAAGGGTVRHVATSVSACFGDTATHAPIVVNLRDGATGAGTIIRAWVLGVGTANDTNCVEEAGLNITGSANTAMTIEFAAASGVATSTTSVNLSGYSTP